MKTLREVRRFLHEKRIDIGLFGVNPEFEAEFNRRVREVYAAIVQENSLPPDTQQLPDDTVLGDRSAELFDDLVDWTDRNADPEPSPIVGLS